MKDEDYSGWEIVETPGEDYSGWEAVSNEPSWGERVHGRGERLRKGIEKYTHGILAPFYGESEKFKKYLNERQNEYEKAVNKTPDISPLWETAGEIGAQLPYLAAGGPILGGFAAGASKMPEEGNGVGGLLGAGEYRGINGLKEAIMGTLFQGIANTPAAIKGLKAGGVAEGVKRLAMGNNTSLAKSIELYEDIFKNIEKAGNHVGIRPPQNIPWEKFNEYVPEKGIKNLLGTKEIEKLLETGKYKDLEKAQSAFSAWQRELNKRAAISGAPNAKAVNALEKAENRVHGKLFDTFQKTDLELAPKYQKANELYAKGAQNNEAFTKALKLLGAGGVVGAGAKGTGWAWNALFGDSK